MPSRRDGDALTKFYHGVAEVLQNEDAETLLDSIAGGGASFEKLADGLPAFAADETAADSGAEEEGFDSDEL